jgi:hypothetical protein
MNPMILHRARLPLWGAILGVLVGAPGLGAQGADTLRQQLRLPQPPTVEVAARGAWLAPGITIGVPSGYGADWGDVFVGLGFQATTRFADVRDGGAVVGLGLGDARRLVGLEVAVTSFGTARSCCRGGMSAKVHRMLPGNTSMALGWENALVWGRLNPDTDLATDAGSSLYGAATKVMVLREDPASAFGSVTATVGAGNGRFRRESDILSDLEGINAFGALGVRLGEPVSGVATWTGQDLNAGLSIVPFRRVPFVITPGVADLTTRARFIVGAGYGVTFSSLY